MVVFLPIISDINRAEDFVPENKGYAYGLMKSI